VWQFGKLLAVDADVQHIEGVFVIEMRDIGYFAADDLVFVGAFRAEPIGVVFNFVVLLLMGNTRVLESDRNVVHVLQDQLV
jgi:hypothetical protein